MRSTRRICAVLLIGSAAVVGCAPRASAPPATPAAQAKPQPAMPEIVRLVGRHFTVTVIAGPKAPLYTVVSDAGDVLAERMTLAELRENNPQVYQDLAPALAPSLRADARDVQEGPIMLDARKD